MHALAEEPGNAAVVERAEQPAFPAEASVECAQVFHRARGVDPVAELPLRTHDLQGHVPARVDVVGVPHLGNSALAEQPDQPILPVHHVLR